jgi:hypothetical protein
LIGKAVGSGTQSGNTNSGKEESVSSLGYIAKLWNILQKDQAIAPNEMLPLATRILSKPQTLAIGRDVMSKLAQRSIVRAVRQVLLKDERNYQELKQDQKLNQQYLDQLPTFNNSGVRPKGEERELVGAGLRRPVNGRSW